MHALSVRQPYAEQIALGTKKIEYRSWRTEHRGDLLIVASLNRSEEEDDFDGLDSSKLVFGGAVCVVSLEKIGGSPGNYEWHLRNPRRVRAIKVRGKLHVFQVDDALIQPVEAVTNEASSSKSVAKPAPRRPAEPPKAKAIEGSNPASSARRKPHRHQKLAIEHLQRWFSTLKANPGQAGYLEMPTGSGKTFTTVCALEPLVKTKARILWIAHNGYLLEQARDTFLAMYPSLEGRIGHLSGRQKSFDAQLTLASIQTLAAGELDVLSELCAKNKPSLVIFDEFHRSAADQWKRVVTSLRKRSIPLLGLSATPTRSSLESRKWLHKAYEQCLFKVGLTELVHAGVLARPRVYRVGVKGKKLAWTAAELRHLEQFHDVPDSMLKRLAQQEERNRLLVQTYKQHEGIQQALVFCCSVDHALHVAQQFTRAGVPSATVTGSADKPDNREALESFRDGRIKVLTSVVLLTEGVDLPKCDTVMIARPTQSEILLKQMIGRALRGPGTGGGPTCTVIDLVDAFSNVQDLSSTSLGFMREYDQNIVPLLREAPTQADRSGADLATLLRVRDWLATHGDIEGARDILLEEVDRVLEFYDRAAGINRTVVVPKAEKVPFMEAVTALREAASENQVGFADSVFAAAAARQAYAQTFGEGSQVSEEDFVNVVGEALTQQDATGNERRFTPIKTAAIIESLKRPLSPTLSAVEKYGGFKDLVDALND